MRKSTAIFGAVAVLALISTGCYNNPHTSERFPGSGPQNYMSRPSVGPGTVAGGSTAGPQPSKPEAGWHAAPQADRDAATPHGPASRTGNEKGGDQRGPAVHAEPQKH